MDIITLTITATLLAPPAPPISDVERFPEREIACRMMEANRVYHKHIEARQQWDIENWWYWQEVLNETDYMYQCWDYLHAARGGEGGDETYWRHSLMRLKELLGNDYYLGKMPPSVPIWRFNHIK